MADDLSEKIRAVLSDPSSMAKISAIASSLGVSSDNAEPPKETEPPKDTVPAFAPADLLLPSRGNDRNTALLCAIKPFLREEKRTKLDSLIRALSVAELISGLKRGGGI